MRTNFYDKSLLFKALQKNKATTLIELKNALGTNSTMTVFRKMNELEYISSYSHSGKYYSLRALAKFDDKGIWSVKSALFSKYGNLLDTICTLINESESGYTTRELEKLLKVNVNNALLELTSRGLLSRDKILGVYVYFSVNNKLRRRQKMFREKTHDEMVINSLQPKILMNELKAAIIMFYSLLDEKQRRLYAGLESLKVGHGGDLKIAELLGLNMKTVAKGRNELLVQKLTVDTVRKKGGGRKEIKKNSTVNK